MVIRAQLSTYVRTFYTGREGRLQHLPLGRPRTAIATGSAQNQRLLSRCFGGALNGASMSISNRASSG